MEKRQAEAAHFATAESRHRQVSWWFGVLRLLLFAFGMFAVVQTFRDNADWVLRGVVPSGLVFVLVVIWHRRIQRRQETARRCKLLARESAARLHGGSGPGASTSIPRQPLSDLDAGRASFLSEGQTHEVAEWIIDDLGIEGTPSLLQQVNTTQSTLGARRLRMLLRTPLLAVPAIRARQQAVQELAEDHDLRDALSLAFFSGRSTPMRRLPGFLVQPRGLPGGVARWVVAASGALTIPLLLLGLSNAMFLPIAALTLAPGLAIRLRLRQQLLALRESWLELGPVFEMTDGVGQVLEQAAVSSAILQSHSKALQQLRDGEQAIRIPRLRQLIVLLRLHEIGFLYGIIDILSQWDLQWLFALEATAGARRQQLEKMTAGLADLESLLALAVMAAEQPGCCVPEIVERDTPLLQIEAGEHPLLPHGEVIANDLSLGDDVRIELVTGSNMAGKSTFLRMIALNTLLALVGAMVRAKAMRMTPFTLEANINVRDSLADGKSYFLVEVERVKWMLESAAKSPFVLTLFDELFRGTNSNERLAASREIARTLASQGGLCLLATHDLELTRLVSEEKIEGIAALHFRDEIDAGKMVFPYKAYRGVSSVHNALKLLELSGYPADLVQRARLFAEQQHPDAAGPAAAP